MAAPIVTTEEFIRRAENTHGSVYDYSVSKFTNGNDYIDMICYVHGEFNVRAKNHISGIGCPECGIESKARKSAERADARIADGTKECSNCKEVKTLDNFVIRRDQKSEGRYTSWCKSCTSEKFRRQWTEDDSNLRNTVYKHKFGITLQQYNQMLDEQDGRCAICKTDKPMGHGNKNGRLSIDHCHESGIVRGLLCHYCNVAIGSVKDDITILANAITYLEKFK